MNDLARRIDNLSPEQRLLLAVQLGDARGVPEPIAIIGMGCRFPGAPNLRAYWQLLTQGQDAICEVPRDRWPLDDFYDADPTQPGKHYCRQGGFLDQIDQFDPEFFGIAPREAAYIDPQQRLLLEVMWEALEDAAIVPQDLSGTKTGVFVGASTLDYGQLLLQQNDQIGAYTTTGLATTMLANRISYLLNFQGPSLSVDTACSSSLVAVHLACQSLWRGESSLALVGGVNVMVTPSLTIGFSKLTALSPDGRCKAFDAAANGFVRAEGAGTVVLKPLSQALAQGDRIYALIRGGAINQDGRTNGLTAPNRESQEQVLRDAYRQARVPLAQVSYIEAHGTGTLLGDPIEAKALGNVFSPTHAEGQPIHIGSVKSNIGHTEAAAGIASLIKVALSLQHQTWVPNLHFHQPNPYILFDRLPLQVQTETQPWPEFSKHAIAGVSSFGFGCTNAHMVLQAPPPISAIDLDLERPSHLLTLSARSETALRSLANQYLDLLPELPEQDLANLCYTANTGRTGFNYRLAARVATPAALQSALAVFAGGVATDTAKTLQTALPGPGKAPAVVWLFTGQGSQYPGMGQLLYQTQPVFRAALERCDEILRAYLDRPLLTILYPDASEDGLIHQTNYTQPALFALEYALAQLWLSWGVQPAAVLGHSVGEYVAACVAGVFSLEDGLRLIAKRGQLMQSLPASGMMAAVMADAETVAQVIASWGDEVAIATLNGPHNTVIAGLREDVEPRLEEFAHRQIAVTPLAVSHAFHSSQMEPILNVFEHVAHQIAFQTPRIPLVTNLTGTYLAPGETLDATYWRRHARQPVRFAEGMVALHEQGYTHFLEIGPHPVLSRLGPQCLPAARDGCWLPSLRRQRDDWAVLGQSLQKLYLDGVLINWQGFDQPYPRHKLALPTYPFQRQRYWVDLPIASQPIAAQPVAQIGALASTDGVPTPEPTSRSAAYSITWQPQSRPAPTAKPRAGAWLMMGDSDDLWPHLSPVLRSRGIRPIRVTPGKDFQQIQPDQYEIDLSQDNPFQPLLTALKAVAQNGRVSSKETRETSHPLTEILYIAPVSPLEEAKAWPDRVAEPVLALLKALVANSDQPYLRLWLITQGAQSVGASDPVVAPPQAILWGLGRTLRLEHPELWGGLIDFPFACLSPHPSPEKTIIPDLVNHILGQDGEDEIALRLGQCWVPRLQRIDLEPDTETAVIAELPIQAEATYLITGGTGGLGLRLARWLVEQGARTLVLVSRRRPKAEVEAALALLRQAGATVWVEAVDVGDRAALSALMHRIQAQLPPLRGLLHAAGTLADGSLINQSLEQFRRVMPAKLQGAWHLHQLTQSLSLDWFVLFSSVTSLLGSPGQGNYAAANAGLDALAYHRHQQGLTALSLSWGPWQEVGMAVEQQTTATTWSQRGMVPLSVAEGLQWLGTVLRRGAALTSPHLGIANLDWAKLLRYLPTATPPPILSTMVASATLPTAEDPVEITGSSARSRLPHLLALSEAERVAELKAYFQSQVATVTGLKQNVPVEAILLDLGFDSLMTMDLLALCKQDLELVLYPREVLAHPTVADLAAYVASELVRIHQPATLEDAEQWEDTSALAHTPWQPPAPLHPLPTHRNPAMGFLLSAPRSGSTLLRVMLAGHPGLFCPPELHLLPFNTLAAQQTALGHSYLQEGLQRAVMELLQVDAHQAQTLLNEWREHETTTPVVYDKLQQMAGGRLLVDKSPTYGLSLETLHRAEQIFERAKYIHLVRHPYAVLDSFVQNRMHKIFDLEPADPYRLAEQVWQTCNKNILAFLKTVDRDRHYFLRYEDLVVDPEATMRDLCDFLGLPFDPAVLTPYEGRRMTDGVSAQSLAVDDPNFRRRSKIEAHLASAWQSIQLPHTLRWANQQLADQFGYALPREQSVETALASPAALPTPLPADYTPLAAMTEDWVTVRGRRYYLCHWGPQDGPRVLCLHGILEHGAAWDGVAFTLAQQGYHVIAPDLRGHGRSEHAGPDGGYQMLDFLGDLDQLTQILGPEPLMMVGHSMGAVLAAILTSLRPERISRLVLVEPVVPASNLAVDITAQLATQLDALATPPSRVVLPSLAAAVQRLRSLKPTLSPQAAQILAKRLTVDTDDGVSWRLDPRLQTRTTLSLSGGLLDRQGYGQLLQTIQVPSTLVLGRDSQFNRPEDRQLLQTSLAQATRFTLPGGHDLPTDDPGGLAQIILAAIALEPRSNSSETAPTTIAPEPSL